MLPLMRSAAILWVVHTALAQSLMAQSNDTILQALPMDRLYIDQITEDASGVFVLTSRIQSNGQRAPALAIACRRSQSNRSYLSIQDISLRSEDIADVEPSLCDKLLVAVRQRKDAQERQ